MLLRSDHRITLPEHGGKHPLKKQLFVVALIGVLLVGLDSSQRAAAVVNDSSRTVPEQRLIPMAVVAPAAILIDHSLILGPDTHVPMAVELVVESGDTLIALLSRAGVVMSDAYAAVRALDGVFKPRDVRPGWTVRLMLQPEDPPRLATLQSFHFQPSVEREIKVSRSDTADGDPFLAVTIPRPLHRVSNVASGTLDNGLFNAAMTAGVPQDLLAEVVALFSFDVDFQRDIRPGDEFEFLYDTFDNEHGEVAKTGELSYAKLILRGKEKPYYRFTPRSGVADLFSPDGHSIRKALLQTPVDARRISSTFGMRRHPILGYNRMHRGVDFAAGAGTPVRAAGDGVVAAAGKAGSYGNYVRIQHKSKYSTAYAHLQSFAKGVSKGTRVRQGQVIGYVGSTGRATGPHLHYEVLIGDRQVNPRGVRLPAGEALAGADLTAFKARVVEVDALRTAPPMGSDATIASTVSAGCDVTSSIERDFTAPFVPRIANPC
jgi:murein DD-endopeptidase MepM/ murein hydrolase activator NlpD